MDNDIMMVEILNTCIALDRVAAQVYNRFSDRAGDGALGEFWGGMALDESRHVAYWMRLLELARAGAVPDLFDDPERIHGELATLFKKAETLVRDIDPANTTAAFLLAVRLEFFMTHRVFGALFQFLSDISAVDEDVSARDEYDAHIEKFIRALNAHADGQPEQEIIGETLLRLWRDTSDLAAGLNTDPLTGVFNRRGLFQTITPLAYLSHRSGYSVGLLMIDVDDFKRVNDTRGHAVGDTVLRAVAHAIRDNLRRSDVLGRYGGEEFLVFLSRIEPESARAVAEKIREAVAQNTDPRVTVSIGACETRLGDIIETSIEAAVKRADANLYAAKAAGKNRVEASTHSVLPEHPHTS